MNNIYNSMEILIKTDYSVPIYLLFIYIINNNLYIG